MSTEEQIEYKSYYTGVFAVNYLFQGMVTSVFAVIVPIHLLINFIAVIDVTQIANIATIIMIPWAIKIFFGILTDKFGIKNFGRRKPWIIGPVCMAGLGWIVLGIPGLMGLGNPITIFLIAGFLIATGGAFGDTATDGLILDICPKEQLGRTQGICWGVRSVGMIAGGPIMALLVVFAGLSVEAVFIILGVLMITTSLTTLLVKEPSEYRDTHVIQHIKQMVNNKKDWKTYIYALFNAFLDGIAVLFVSIFILVELHLMTLTGTELSLPTDDLMIYVYNGNINLIISAGIVIGSIIGGRISDLVSRKLSSYVSFLLTTVVLLLIMLPLGGMFSLIMSCCLGFAIGYRHSSYAAVIGEYSKKHPEMSGTYYSICNSFANIGSTVGIIITGRLFDLTGAWWTIFLFMAIISNLGLLGFYFMDPKDYESSRE